MNSGDLPGIAGIPPVRVHQSMVGALGMEHHEGSMLVVWIRGGHGSLLIEANAWSRTQVTGPDSLQATSSETDHLEMHKEPTSVDLRQSKQDQAGT